MFLRNTETKEEGLWLKSEDNNLIVWNTTLNVRQTWPLELTECITHDSPQSDFLELLEHLTSTAGLELVKECDVMLFASKSIAFYVNSGLFAREKNVQKMIQTVQEVLYFVSGINNSLGKDRDELMLFIHQHVPSLFLGAYWGYSTAKMAFTVTPPEHECKKEAPLRRKPSFWQYFCRCRNL
jgi:hypothetical protein